MDAATNRFYREAETSEQKYARQMAEVTGYNPPLDDGAQGSITWLMQRVGHCTASRFKDANDFTKAGKSGAAREAYKVELVIERLTGRPTEHFVTGAMKDGIEREPMAKMAYEARTGAMLVNSGFRHHKTIKWVGGSPDALIGERGGFEAKCPTPAKHIATLQNGMPEEHIPQVQGLMWNEGRDWWDFASYNPIFPDNLQLYIQRIPRDDKYIATLEAGIITFLAEVDALHQALIKIGAAQVAPAKDEISDSVLAAAPSISNQI